jgi:glutathione S-transferase
LTLKLYGSQLSPFARKAMVIAREMDLKLEILPRPEDAEAFRRINPLGKIPALVLDDGSVLFDSPVICEYLNEIGGGKFFPGASLWRNTTGRWKAQVLHALADGIADAAVALVVEQRQPTPNEAHLTRHRTALLSGLDALERIKFAENPTIGEVAAACALGYVDFRLAELDWRATRPKLSAWFEKFSQYPSMKSTTPK